MDYSIFKLKEEKIYAQFLEEKLNIPLLWSLIEEKKYSEEIIEFTRTFSLCLNESVGKEIYNACKEVLRNLNLPDDFAEFYISNSSEFNAYVIPFKEGELTKKIVVLYRDLVENSPLDEIKFIIGHEFGHVLLEHFKIMRTIDFLYQEEKNKPPLLLSTCRYWRQLSELSADRIALLSIRDIETGIKALFRLASGLKEEKLNIDYRQIIEFAKNDLDKLSKGEGISKYNPTHPPISIRILALLEFYNSKLYRSFTKGKIMEDENLNKKMEELLGSFQKNINYESDLVFVLFLISAGTLMMQVDEEIAESESITLCNLLSDFVPFPFLLVKEVLQEKKGKLSEILKTVSKIIVEKYSYLRKILLSRLVIILIRDGKIKNEEFELFMKIAVDELHFSPTEAKEIFIEALSNIQPFLKPLF